MRKSKAVSVNQTKPYPRFLTFLFAVLGVACVYPTLRANSPTLYDSNATVSGELLKIPIVNKGRTARIGKGWCAAGALLTPGTPQITKLVNGSTTDFFRHAFLAPDEQETLEMLVPVSIKQVKPDTNWVVVCSIPYWDTLAKLVKSETLNMCYEVQTNGRDGERQAVRCPPESLDEILQKLKP